MGRSISKGLVLDLSATGCLLETDCSFSIGEMVEIEIYENEDLLFRCKVIWSGDELLGCEFEEPIPGHVLDEARLWSVPSAIGEAIDGAAEDQLAIAIGSARKSVGLTAAELARRTGVSRPTLWAWETGRSRPSAENLENLKRALNLQARKDHLADRDDDGERPVSGSMKEIVDRHRRSLAQEIGASPKQVKVRIVFD